MDKSYYFFRVNGEESRHFHAEFSWPLSTSINTGQDLRTGIDSYQCHFSSIVDVTHNFARFEFTMTTEKISTHPATQPLFPRYEGSKVLWCDGLLPRLSIVHKDTETDDLLLLALCKVYLSNK
jgi:hypothetical protein